MTDRLATERWINEGGRLAPEAVIERELRARDHRRRRRPARPRVLIAGGGVAGLETLLALRALAGDRADITLVTPDLRFVNRSMPSTSRSEPSAALPSPPLPAHACAASRADAKGSSTPHPTPALGSFAFSGATDNNARNAGVMIVDIDNPRRSRLVRPMLPPLEANVGESSRELRVWHSQFEPPPRTSYSAHNPTLTPNVVFTTWHLGGFQAIAIEDPTYPYQLARFMPRPLPQVTMEDPRLSSDPDTGQGEKVVMWSYPIIKDGLIYVVALRNGLYMLRYKGRFDREVERIDFLECNSNQGDARCYEPVGRPPGSCR